MGGTQQEEEVECSAAGKHSIPPEIVEVLLFVLNTTFLL